MCLCVWGGYRVCVCGEGSVCVCVCVCVEGRVCVRVHVCGVYVSIFPLTTLTSGDLVATRKALVLPGWSKSCIAAAM